MIDIDVEIIKEMASKGKRLDGREFDKYRSISIEPNFVTSAEGSCRVKLGNTEVLAGIKMDLGKPFDDTPNEGVLVVSAELVPFANPLFEAGPAKEDAIELSRVVDRAIRESKCIDFGKLCVTPGEKVWMVNLDIAVLDDDGNLFDACGIAAMAALLNTMIPDIEDDKPVYTKKGKNKLPLNGVALSTTFVKIGDKIIADPNLAELRAMDARLTVGTIDENFCSMQKGGKSGIKVEEIESIIELARQKSAEIKSLIKG